MKKEINLLKKAYRKGSSEEEKAGISLLQDDLRTKWKSLRAAETLRKRRWRRKEIRRKFYQDPYKTAKEVLDAKSYSEPKVSKEVLDQYIAEVACDPLREEPLKLRVIPYEKSPWKN